MTPPEVPHYLRACHYRKARVRFLIAAVRETKDVYHYMYLVVAIPTPRTRHYKSENHGSLGYDLKDQLSVTLRLWHDKETTMICPERQTLVKIWGTWPKSSDLSI